MKLPAPAGSGSVLVVGLPRSGTTWVGRALSRADGGCYLHEPDNEKLDPFALRAKRAIGRFPALEPPDAAPTEYERLWQGALTEVAGPQLARRDQLARRLFAGASPTELEKAVGERRLSPRLRLAALSARSPLRPEPARRPVVKSVHLALALHWAASRWRPRVVVVVRHPFDVLASVTEMGLADRSRRLDLDPEVRRRYVDRWGVPVPASGATPLARATWQVGLLASALEEQVRHLPQATVVSHESLCIDSEARFRALFSDLDLAWTPEAAALLASSDRPGAGYGTRRISKAQPGRWRERLAAAQLDEIRTVLEPFPLAAAADLDT